MTAGGKEPLHRAKSSKRRPLRRKGHGTRQAAFAWCCVALALLSLVMIVRALRESHRARAAYDALRTEAVTDIGAAGADKEKEADVAPKEPETVVFYRPEGAVLEIDFDALKAVNPDVVAWLHVPALDISYPVLQGTDNDYYLNHTPEGEENSLGSIFLEYTNAPDFSHGNSIIYGHNTADGTMFGRLRLFGEDPALREEEPFFYVYLPDGFIGKYRIYSYYSVYKESESFSRFEADDAASHAYYVNLTKGLSLEEIEADLSGGGRIVTLATCFGAHGTSYRFLVHGIAE